MPRNDQPFVNINYNTDQFIDPYTGATVHDDGFDFYTQPFTRIIYAKQRTFNGLGLGYISYQITLTNTTLIGPFLTAEDGTPLLDENGMPLIPG